MLQTVIGVLITFLSLSTGLLEANNRQMTRQIDSFSESMSQKYHLSLTTSLNINEDEINEVTLIYSSKEPVELKGARLLIGDMAQDFVDTLNHKTSLEKESTPFTQKQLEIIIFFRGRNQDYSAPPQVAQVYLQNGWVSYFQYQNEKFNLISKEKL